MRLQSSVPLLLIVVLAGVKCNKTNTTQGLGTDKYPQNDRKPSLVSRSEEDLAYDETYYNDIGNIADLRNRTFNFTANDDDDDDDEDLTNGGYLDELGSATDDDVFENFNPDLEANFVTSETTALPTTTQQNDDSQEHIEVREPLYNIRNIMPNYTNDTLPKCPVGYETHYDEDNTVTCYLEHSVTEYPPPCDYSNHLDSHTLPYQITTGKKLWTKPLSKIFDNFGEAFVTSTWSYNSHTNPACATSEKSTITPSSCTTPHSSICAYKYDDKKYSFDDYCKKRFNDSCVAADLGTGHRCYCISRLDQSGQSRNTFCDRLAEPRQPYQNVFLLKKLTVNDICWIGIYQDVVDGVFKWSSSNHSTDYTYWSFTTDFTKRHVAISQAAWSLENDGDLKCAICEVSMRDYETVSLRIKYNRVTNKIRLTVDNAKEIYGGVTCYSYSNEYYIDLQSNTENHLEVDVYDVNDIPRYYWCKTLQVPHLDLVYSNRILAYTRPLQAGREYAIANKLEIPNSPYFMTQLIFNETNNLLYHIHTVPNNYTVQEEVDFLSRFISADIKNCEVCLPSTTSSNSITLNWSQTPIGSTALPDVYCYQNNGYPVTRKCVGTFLRGATWSPVNGTCDNLAQINATILYSKLVQPQNEFNTSHQKIPTILETHIIVDHLTKLQSVTELIEAVDNLINLPQNQLRNTQYLLNSTDTLLEVLNTRVAEEADDSLASFVFKNLAVYFLNLSNVSTIGFKLNSSQTFDISNTTDFGSDFDIVLRIPEQLYKDLEKCSKNPVSLKLALIALRNDALFGDWQHSGLVSGNVALITTHQAECISTTVIEVLFKENSKDAGKVLKCGFWNYGTNELLENTRGSWNVESSVIGFGSYQTCRIDLNSYTTVVQEREDNHAEYFVGNTVLIALGVLVSVVSITSLLCILTTAFVFKCHSYSHIAVISLSLSATAQLILTFVNVVMKLEGVACVTLAAGVHYTILVQFIIMVVIVWLQHRLYVTTEQPNEKLMVRTCFISWLLPLLIIIILASISSNNYGKISSDVCYAMGKNFTYSFLLPVSIFLLLILIMFVRIIVKLRYSQKIRTYHLTKETSFSQLRVAAILFLLLGITWGLGILTAVVERKVIPFMYCIAACLQEVIILLLFILLDDNTRSLWVGVKNVCCMGKSKGYQLTPKRKKRTLKYSTSQF